jgi:hypothetical protein
MNAKQWAQLRYDQAYKPPQYFVPFLLKKDTYWRTNIQGGIEYLNEKADLRFFGLEASKQTTNKKERLKKLVANQKVIIEMLDVLGFPFNFNSINQICLIMYERSAFEEREQKRLKNRATWFLTCIAAITLVYYFGGILKFHKKVGLVVNISRINVVVLIENRVTEDKGYNFPNWFYELFYRLWNHTHKGALLDVSDINCVVKFKTE